MSARKLLLWFVTLSVVVGAFVAYNHFFGAPPMVVGGDADTVEIEPKNFGESFSGLGGMKIGDMKTRARFVDLDAVTKKVTRVFGYSEFLNPDQGTDNWKMNKPYMQVFGKDSQYSITSDRGTVRVEDVAGKMSPTDAHLKDNVLIRITPTAEGGVGMDTTITLDDLVYDSERSEFSTKGPVKILSPKGHMEGTGLLMIYNPAEGRIEYLEVMKLHKIYLKDVSKLSSSSSDESDDPVSDSPAKGSSEVAEVGQDDAVDGVADAKAGAGSEVEAEIEIAAGDGSVALTDETQEDVPEEDFYYDCFITDNVIIKYGSRLTVVGADEVVVSNILFAGNSSDPGEDDGLSSGDVIDAGDGAADVTAKADQSEGQTAVRATESAEIKVDAESETAEVAATDESQQGGKEVEDLTITCNGSLIIKPAESQPSPGTLPSLRPIRIIEFAGSPVKIAQPSEDPDVDPTTVASCGILKYNIDADVLDMFTTEAEKYISLNMVDADASIKTAGNVQWRRNDDSAMINGPGKMVVKSNSESEASSGPTELIFDGVMDLFFAESLPGEENKLILKAANLAGGMLAKIAQESPSQVSAENAFFTFDEKSQILGANLSGDVKFSSANGKLTSDQADIFFDEDDAGKSYAYAVTSTGNPTLEMATAATEEEARPAGEPAKFYATKIDYDLVTGDALAYGPVKFIFYEEPNEFELDAKPIPMIITADESAQYFGEKNRIVFNENVVGTRTEETVQYDQVNVFRGQKLIVDLAAGADGGMAESTNVDHIRITGGIVKLESLRKAGEVVLSNVVLTCSQLDYDDADGVIVAAGPGEMLVNNENAPVPTEEKGKSMDMQGPCYAYMTGFESLKWFSKDHKVIADGQLDSLYMSYIPLEDGVAGPVTKVSTSRIEADFIKTLEGRNELVNMNASGGVTYSEEFGNEFIGDNLDYDVGNSLVTITGSDAIACQFNGVLVEKIEYDPTTEEVKAEMSSTPSSMSSPRKIKKR